MDVGTIDAIEENQEETKRSKVGRSGSSKTGGGKNGGRGPGGPGGDGPKNDEDLDPQRFKKGLGIIARNAKTQVQLVDAKRAAEVLQDHAAMLGHVERLGVAVERVEPPLRSIPGPERS